MTRYVLGFAFNAARTKVLLISKKRPDWQAGKLNGIGGHIEDGESAFRAMCREALEEAGLTRARWNFVATMRRVQVEPAFEVLVFRAFLGKRFRSRAETKTDEPVGWYRVDRLPGSILPNLKWLIPMLLEREEPPYIVEATIC